MGAVGQLEANKQLVLDFLGEVTASRSPGVAGKYVAGDFRLHAPDLATGPEAAEEYARQFSGGQRPPDVVSAGEQLFPVFTVAENDLVTVCLYFPQPEPGEPGRTYDYFSFATCRIQDGKIAECWPSTHKYAPVRRPPDTAAGRGRATRPRRVGATDLTANKRLVRDFYDRVFGTMDPGTVRDFVADDYHQHSSHMPQGRSGLEEFVGKLAASAPRPAAPAAAPARPPSLPEPDVLVAEGDIVVIAACLPQPEPGGSGARWPYYAYDAYRVKNGKLAEHWSGINKAAPPQHG